jgi:hypothetical protein
MFVYKWLFSLSCLFSCSTEEAKAFTTEDTEEHRETNRPVNYQRFGALR